jgi:ribosomal protein L3 glutamine methyltransferase
VEDGGGEFVKRVHFAANYTFILSDFTFFSHFFPTFSLKSQAQSDLEDSIMSNLADDFLTLRDLLRYAVSRFTEAKLVFEQGTNNALDEAAFLLLWGLNLPIDQLDPFIDARLTKPERVKLLGIIEARISTRKPAAYITGQAWIKTRSFIVDERVIIPRSYIGEMLASDASVLETGPVRTVLDLCTGCGCLAILAALAFPDAQVDAADLSAEALEVAKLNVKDYEMEDQVRLIEGDLFAPLKGKRYDLIVCNPPYVRDASVARYAPEHASEPLLAHAGGPDGLVLVRKILAEAAQHLEPEGRLLVEVGYGQAKLAADRADLPFLWLETEDSQGDMFLLTREDLLAAAPAKAAPKRRK